MYYHSDSNQVFLCNEIDGFTKQHVPSLVFLIYLSLGEQKALDVYTWAILVSAWIVLTGYVMTIINWRKSCQFTDIICTDLYSIMIIYINPQGSKG